jgi:hypothetical protein
MQLRINFTRVLNMSRARAGNGTLSHSLTNGVIDDAFDDLTRLKSMLNRIGPTIDSPAPATSQNEIERVWQAIKARFQKHEHRQKTEIQDFMQPVQEINDERLLHFSNQKLKNLLLRLKELPVFTRK